MRDALNLPFINRQTNTVIANQTIKHKHDHSLEMRKRVAYRAGPVTILKKKTTFKSTIYLDLHYDQLSDQSKDPSIRQNSQAI